MSPLGGAEDRTETSAARAGALRGVVFRERKDKTRSEVRISLKERAEGTEVEALW